MVTQGRLVERVAKAIHRQRCITAAPCPSWDDAGAVLRETARALARAAVFAMRECDGEMVEAGAEELDPYVTQAKPWGQSCERAIDIYVAMIDRALRG